MNAAIKQPNDFLVKDLSLADWGRKEIKIAETEMPGLMAIRHEFAAQQPLRGARITGSLHMTIQTAVLIETLNALGAQVRWASCNIYSTQDHAAAAIAAGGTPVFAVKGESLAEYWDYTHRIFEWPDGGYSNMILDDGGDATLLLHLGAKAEKDASLIAKPGNEEEECLFAAIKAKLKIDPKWYSTRLAKIKGVTEETTTGVKRLYQMAKDGQLAFPGVQRQRLGHQVEVRQSVRLPRIAGGCHQARHRRHDRRQGGRGVRLRRCGQGLGAGAARAVGAGVGDRDRSDLRAAGGDGRLSRRHHGLCGRQGRHLRLGHRQLPCHHARSHEAHEGSGHRVQHRPFRQRNRSGGAPAIHLGQHQAAGRSRDFPRRQAHHSAGRGPLGELGLRHRPSVLRDELLVRESGAGADRAVRQHQEISRSACTCCRSISTKRWRGCSCPSSARS